MLDWFIQQGRNVRQALVPKQQPVQTPAPTRQEPATVFYGRGYTNPAATAPARQTAAKPVQPVQELKKALAPKPIQQPIAVRPVQQPKQGTPQDITKPIYDAGVGASQWWTKNAAPAITPELAYLSRLRDYHPLNDEYLSRLRDYHPLTAPIHSPVGSAIIEVASGRAVMPWDTEARHKEHAAAYDEYRTLQQEYAGNIKGDTFIANTPQDMGRYNRLQTAAARVETTGKTFEDAQKRELFGISKGVSDANQGLASWLNLPKVTPAAERVLRVVIPKSVSERVLGMSLRSMGGDSVGAKSPEFGQFRLGMVVGGYERFRTEPLTAGTSLALGFVGGGVAKGATLLPKIGPVIVSKGPAISKGVEVLYGGSVGVRTGMAGPDYFEMGREFGGILTTEAIPMYGGVKAFTAVSPRVAAGIYRARGEYASYKIRDAPAAQVKGGYYPDGESLLEGLKMREGLSPFPSGRSLSRSRPGKSGRLVEVGPDRYVEKKLLSSHLQKYVAPPEPMPPEFIAREDILDVPAHWRTPEFGGRFGRQEPVQGWLERRIAGGPYPDGEMLLEGLKMREGMGAFTPARSLSRGRSGKSGRLVEVGPGRYVEKKLLSSHLQKYVAPPEPMPPEFIAREDILDVPAHWRTPEFGGDFSAPVKVTKMYAGIPGIPMRPAARQRVGGGSRRSAYSLSGRSLRVRPPAADLSLGEAVSARFAVPVMIEPTISSRSRSDILTALNLGSDLASQMNVDSSEILKSALNLNSSLVLGSVQASAQEQALGQTSTSRQGLRQRQRTDTTQLRTRISAPRPPRTRVPEVPPLKVPPFPGEGRRKKGRKRKAQTAYDWLVTNPVPDIEFSLGGAGSFDAPARQKGKKTPRRSPVAGPPAGFFEVGKF